jgi:putative PIN family toxin of toxin-antitoxin system
MKKIVLDTDVVVAALRSPAGASAPLLKFIERGDGTMLLSVALALEYEAVCLRTEHRSAAGLSRREIDVFIDGLVGLGEPVSAHFRWRPLLHDAGDEMVLEAAVNGRADWLVTFNMQDYRKAPAAFGIELLFPREALRRIRT